MIFNKKRDLKGFLILFLAVVMIFGSSIYVKADNVANEGLINAYGNVTNQLIKSTDEQISQLEQTNDKFVENIANIWKSSKRELGVPKSDVDISNAKVEKDKKEIVITIPVKFENADADFIYTVDGTGKGKSFTLDIKYPLIVNLKHAGLNTIIGLGTVFFVLIFISFIIHLFKYVNAYASPKKEVKKEEQEIYDNVESPYTPVEIDHTNEQELVAVIMAAICEYEGTDNTDSYVVKSIRRIKK